MASPAEINIAVKSYPMNGGDGPLSYTQNSTFQKKVTDTAKNLITEVIVNYLDIDNPIFKSCSNFRIADLGCSVGPNTFFAVENILDAVEHKYKANKKNSATPDFQVFFNDHVGNDFNTLFRNIPQPSPYFAAGVPGSFYGRLFPKSTLHIVHSAIALHWLSTVPKEVVDKNSPAWNKGRIYCSGIEQKAAEAFAAQYKKDMDVLLNARAAEVVRGGLMMLLMGGTREGVTQSQYLMGKIYDILGSCLLDLAKKGLTSEEKVDSFNMPHYFPSTKEIENIILKNGYFSLERMELVIHSRFEILRNIPAWVQNMRAGLEEVIKDHFGNEIIDELFKRFSNKLVENQSILLEDPDNDGITLFIVLKRRILE